MDITEETRPPRFQDLGGRDLVVIQNALNFVRDHIQTTGKANRTPDIDATLSKIESLLTPDTKSLVLGYGAFAAFSDRHLEMLVCALDEEPDRWTRIDDQRQIHALSRAAQSELEARPWITYPDDE